MVERRSAVTGYKLSSLQSSVAVADHVVVDVEATVLLSILGLLRLLLIIDLTCSAWCFDTKKVVSNLPLHLADMTFGSHNRRDQIW